MTSNQINYWNLQETKRANLVNEGIKSDTLSETKRSNLVREGLEARKTSAYESRVKSQNRNDSWNTANNVVKTFIPTADGALKAGASMAKLFV